MAVHIPRTTDHGPRTTDHLPWTACRFAGDKATRASMVDRALSFRASSKLARSSVAAPQGCGPRPPPLQPGGHVANGRSLGRTARRRAEEEPPALALTV